MTRDGESASVRRGSPATFTKLLRNAGLLLSGNVVSAGIGFIAVMLTARALGPHDFGLLALVSSYVLVVDRLVNFQSWQALVKYGADHLVKGNVTSFRRLVKFASLVDFSTAAIGSVVAAGGAALVGHWRGWDRDIVLIAIAYSAVIFVHVSGTPIAILRLYNRFDLLAVQQVVPSAVRAVGAAVLWLVDGTLAQFAVVWIIADAVGHLVFLGMGWWELRRQGIKGIRREPFTGVRQESPGLFMFMLTTNVNASVRMSTRELDILLVGVLLDATAVGLYKVAKQFATVLSRVVDPLYHAIYPELARVWASRDYREFRHLLLRSSALASGVGSVAWIGFLLFGKLAIALTVGGEFVDAYGVLLAYTFAVVLSVWSVALQPAMLALGRPGTSLSVGLASTALYFAVLFPFVTRFGILGAGLAYIAYYALWSILMAVLVHRAVSRALRSDSVARA